MSASFPFVAGKFREFDLAGFPLVGGQLFTYQAGTLSPLATYISQNGLSANTNPVILDASGRANVWISPGVGYRMILKDQFSNTIWDVDNIVASDVTSTMLSQSSGSSLLGFIQGLAGATSRTVQDKLRDVVSVKDFGAKGDGTTDDTSAFVTALATGRDVYVPAGTYKVTSTLALATANQRILGSGWGAQINFTFASANYGITTSNSTGWQRIESLFLNGVSNVTALVNIGSPDLTVQGNYILNATATGHGIWQQDENGGTNTFGFDARIEGNLIFGVKAAGNYGIRLGLNHQGTKILRNSVQNWGNHLYINGATTLTTVMFNIFQRSDTAGGTPAAVVISKAGSAMPCYDIAIEHNYFEQNQVVVYVDDCDLQNFTLRKNYCYRNTTSAAGSAIYKTGANTSAASARIQVDDNRAEGFEYVFALNNQYAANITSAKNNTVVFAATAYNSGTAYSVGQAVISAGITYYCISPTTGNTPPNATYWAQTGYATGTYASSAYTIRQINPFFGGVSLSGSYASAANVTRVEFGTLTSSAAFRWERGEYLDSIQVRCIKTSGAPTTTLALHQVSGDTDTSIVSSGSVAADGTLTLLVNAYPVPGANYYLSDAGVAGGGTSYRYPYQAYIRA